MTTVRIADIANVIRGVSWDKSVALNVSRAGYLPILRAGNISDVLNIDDDLVWVPSSNVSEIQSIRAGDIAICMSSGSVSIVGKTAFAKTNWPGSVGAFCALLRADASQCMPEYLGFYLQSAKFRRWTREAQGANIKNIRKSALEDFAIPLPPLPEQRRIVDILSRAEGIVRLRREAQRKAAELTPAIFLDLFGDPATNPKGWPVASLGDNVEIASVVRTPDLVRDADQPCIGADSIESHTGKLIGLTTVREVQPKSGKYWFDFGDVLYSKIRPYLAKASLAPREGYCSADMYPLRCKSTLRADYLLGLLLSKAFTDYATAESVRAQMPKLNRETLFAYQLPVPPIEIQEQFTEKATAIRSIQSQQVAATEKAEATFAALLAQVFTN